MNEYTIFIYDDGDNLITKSGELGYIVGLGMLAMARRWDYVIYDSMGVKYSTNMQMGLVS